MSRLISLFALAALLSACGRFGFPEGGKGGVTSPTAPNTGDDGSASIDFPPSAGSDDGGFDADVSRSMNNGDPSSDADAGSNGGNGTDAADGGGSGPPSDAQVPAAPIDWASLPGGTFDMGSTANANSQPVHAVTVGAFSMGRTEVTVAQYNACIKDGACGEPGTFSPTCYWNDVAFADYPVNCVSHTQAGDFCAWVGGRLPTEAEWEYAARSLGQAQSFPWGNSAPTCDTVIFSLGGDGCGTGLPWPVCSKSSGNTAQGMCDMAGNLFEWVLDGWHDTYTGAPTDGTAWSGSTKVVRGGAFQSASWTTSQRGVYFGPTYLNTFIGFRCARSP